MPITAEQRAWLEELGRAVGRADPAPGPPAAGVTPASGGRMVAPAALQDDAVGFGPQDIPGEVIEKILGPLSATCMINNNTPQMLRVDPDSQRETDDDSGKVIGLAWGEWDEFPPDLIAEREQSKKFVARNAATDLIIVTVHTAGIEGWVRYFIDDQKTAWVLHFNNPRKGDNTADARLEGPNKDLYETPNVKKGGGNDAKFLFVLNPKGGPQPPAPPAPTPAPASQARSSCLVTVVNETDLPLFRAEAEHVRGDFMMPPPRRVEPGAVINFVSVETPEAQEQGCKGFVVWEVGEPMVASWRIEWDNPENAKNDATGTLTPAGAGLRTQDVIGQGDENVPVSFTLSGKAAGPGPTPPPGPGPAPGPAPAPTPAPAPDFKPPPESKQPTLRKGDKGADGWVEYLQSLLVKHGHKVDIDGSFGQGTHSAVTQFQQAKGLMVDGVVGNQTWAALREGSPEAPSTDGRDPHSYTEKGQEARWALESPSCNRYFAAEDRFELAARSVGDTPLDAKVQAAVRITPPGGSAKTVWMPLGKPREGGGGSSFIHIVEIAQFRKTFPSEPADAPITGYRVEAYLPEELGGDFYDANVRPAA